METRYSSFRVLSLFNFLSSLIFDAPLYTALHTDCQNPYLDETLGFFGIPQNSEDCLTDLKHHPSACSCFNLFRAFDSVQHQELVYSEVLPAGGNPYRRYLTLGKALFAF